MHGDVRPGHYAMIAVSDTGTGIPAAILDKVFEPFFTTKGARQGHRPRPEHGLRLRQAVRRAHQDLQRRGPRDDDQDLSAAGHRSFGLRPRPFRAPESQGGNETILVVEDDKLVRDYVLTQLQSLGYVTLDAENATRGAWRSSSRRQPFDLLFTDVIMPGLMNGRQLADEIAEDQTRTEGAVYLGLYRKCDHPSRPARPGRAAARQTLSQVGHGSS